MFSVGIFHRFKGSKVSFRKALIWFSQTSYCLKKKKSYLSWSIVITYLGKCWSPAPEMQGRDYLTSLVAKQVENQRWISQAYTRKQGATQGFKRRLSDFKAQVIFLLWLLIIRCLSPQLNSKYLMDKVHTLLNFVSSESSSATDTQRALCNFC